MVGDFTFSDSGAQLALANAEYWRASASFHSHFRSGILFSFIYYHYLEILALRVSGSDFLKVVSSSDIIKTLKARSQILKPGSRGLLKCKVTILLQLPYEYHLLAVESDFLKVVSSSDIIKTLKARSHILKPGSRGLLKCKVTILYPFSYISSTLHIARIVCNIIEITLISFKLNINHLSLPLTKNCYDLIENRKYCRLKIYIWSQSTLPILLSTP